MDPIKLTLSLILLLITLSACEGETTPPTPTHLPLTSPRNTVEADTPRFPPPASPRSTAEGDASRSAPLVHTPAYLNPGHVIIEPAGMVRFTPEPVAGTPEPDPKLTMRVTLVDAYTHRPVQGDVLVGDAEGQGDTIYTAVSHFTLELPGEALDIIHVAIQAEGYKTWHQGYRYHLDHSRTWNLIIKLAPIDVTPPPGQTGKASAQTTRR